jgi:hypothetical protein
MSLSKKLSLLLFSFIVLLVPSGALSAVHSEPLSQTLEDRAFVCLTDVYPLNLTHYNITADPIHTLSSASDTFTTQAINYKLNSPDGNLVADCMFKDGKLYQLSLSVINGLVTTERKYDNLTDAARDFLVKYQVFSGADSTELIQLLNQFDEDKNTSITMGNISFSVSHLGLPTTGIVTTSYSWRYSLNGEDDTVVGLTFANNTFGGFFDSRQLYRVGSDEAINTAINYLENYSYIAPDGTQVNELNVNKNGSVALFSPSMQNGTMQPRWNVTIDLGQTYQGGINALQLEVLANSGEIISCRNQSVSSLQVNDSGMNLAVIETSIGGIAALTLVVVIILILRRKQHLSIEYHRST